jgi:hypothetical protein
MPWGLPRIIDSPSKYKPHIGYPGVQGNPDVSHVEITRVTRRHTYRERCPI